MLEGETRPGPYLALDAPGQLHHQPGGHEPDFPGVQRYLFGRADIEAGRVGRRPLGEREIGVGRQPSEAHPGAERVRPAPGGILPTVPLEYRHALAFPFRKVSTLLQDMPNASATP